MKTFDERKECVQQYLSNMKRKRRKTTVTFTCLTLVVCILALVLFVPYNTTPPSVRQYAHSEYYGVIQRINELNFAKPKYKNNFHAMIGFLSDFGAKSGDAIAGAPNVDGIGIQINGSKLPEASPSGTKGEQYVEVTDNQVTGVTEADIFKRSDKYVYYLRDTTLYIYTIAQENTQIAGAHIIEMKDDLSYIRNAEMYLSTDCSRVTVIAQGYHKELGTLTQIVSLDVSDPENIRETGRVYFRGNYLSSRVVEGDLLLTYNYGFQPADVDFDDPATFVPQYGTPGDMTCIPGSNIVCPEDVTSAHYTVICKLDGESLELMGTTALLGYSQELYVSEDTIYATRSYNDKEQGLLDIEYRQTAMTQITGISYTGDTLRVVGTITVEGTVRNQYSMDQYDGILRVVTSTTVSFMKETVYNDAAITIGWVTDRVTARERNVNLYCIDLNNWEIAAEVIAFAPEGEDAQSVRFDGVNAYVCTAEVITLTDPVYFFDLSDLDNITWTDTGTIDGFSTSLIQLGDGYLLGVGYGTGRNLKIEVYEECGGKVVSVCAYERNAGFSEEYKSYFVDRDNNLFGLAIYDWNTKVTQYILLHFDGCALQELVSIPIHQLSVGKLGMSAARAFLDDGWLYVLTSDAKGIYTLKVW